jgi:hypothetical protein
MTQKYHSPADIRAMKQILFLFLTSILFLGNAKTSFEKKASKENTEAMKNEKVKCRWVCDKKLYKEQKIADAISFYKNSKDYTFSKKDF